MWWIIFYFFRYYNWPTAAPLLLAMQAFQKPLPKVLKQGYECRRKLFTKEIWRLLLVVLFLVGLGILLLHYFDSLTWTNYGDEDFWLFLDFPHLHDCFESKTQSQRVTMIVGNCQKKTCSDSPSCSFHDTSPVALFSIHETSSPYYWVFTSHIHLLVVYFENQYVSILGSILSLRA